MTDGLAERHALVTARSDSDPGRVAQAAAVLDPDRVTMASRGLDAGPAVALTLLLVSPQ